MSEHAPHRERRRVNVLRPRIELSPELENLISENLSPVGGVTAEYIGSYVTKSVVVDSVLYSSGVYQEGMDAYEQTLKSSRLQLGARKTDQANTKSLAINMRRVPDRRHMVEVALRPRNTALFSKALKYLEFNNQFIDESARPYEVHSPPGGNEFVIATFKKAELNFIPGSEGFKNLLKAMHTSVTHPHFQAPYYMSALELKVSPDEMRSVPIRPTQPSSEVA